MKHKPKRRSIPLSMYSSKSRKRREDMFHQASKISPCLVKGYHVGNYTVVDKKSWLEVCDRKHRYGAYLRAYYEEWKRRQCPHSDFWTWLENDPVEVEEVPRHKLEQETVLYCSTHAERRQFMLDVVDGVLIHHETQLPISTDSLGWIFVLQGGVLYGECVQAAGMLVVDNGKLTKLYPHSGHYRPSEDELRVLLLFLQDHKVCLETVLVDAQRVQKASRDSNKEGQRLKKTNSALFWTGRDLLSFLCRKNEAWSCHLFDELTETCTTKRRVIC